jgi:hypothetical protein
MSRVTVKMKAINLQTARAQIVRNSRQTVRVIGNVKFNGTDARREQTFNAWPIDRTVLAAQDDVWTWSQVDPETIELRLQVWINGQQWGPTTEVHMAAPFAPCQGSAEHSEYTLEWQLDTSAPDAPAPQTGRVTVTEEDPRAAAAVVPSTQSQICIQNPSSCASNTFASGCSRVHYWSGNLPGDDYLRDSAWCHAERLDGVLGRIDSLAQLKQGLMAMASPIRYMSLHAHGNIARIFFQRGPNLTLANIRAELNGLDSAFVRGARIDLFGCNIAEDFAGETFLYEVCAQLLKKGGTAVANIHVHRGHAGWSLYDNWLRLHRGYGCLDHEGGSADDGYGWVKWTATPQNARLRMVGENIAWTVPNLRRRFEQDRDRYQAVRRSRTAREREAMAIHLDWIDNHLTAMEGENQPRRDLGRVSEVSRQFQLVENTLREWEQDAIPRFDGNY